MPHVSEIITPISHNKFSKGYKCPISTVFPTCSQVNQVNIITGSTPNDHGIVGDYCIDGNITDSNSLFSDSILTELSHDDVNVLFMTLTEPYREQLTYDFHPNSTSLSLELLHKYANDIETMPNMNNILIPSILENNNIYNRLKELSIYFNHQKRRMCIVFIRNYEICA